MQSVHTLLKPAQLRWTGHVTCLMSGSLWRNARKKGLTRWPKKCYKKPLKPRLRTSIFQLSPGNRLLRIEQSGVASSTKVPPNLKQRESVKLKGSVKNGKQEPRDHHQTQHSPNSLALFATDSLDWLIQPSTHTQTHINA